MEAPKPDKPLNLHFLWFPLMQAPFIYLAIAYFVRQSGAPPPADSAAAGMMTAVFGLLSAVQAAAAFAVLPRFRAKMEKIPYWMTRWALAEAISLYGLILFFMGGPWISLLCFVSVSITLLLALRPSEG